MLESKVYPVDARGVTQTLDSLASYNELARLAKTNNE